ncbi:MAG: tRNA1(Val) (adenine(37)-N6)-methyltransferase [Clostridiales bacterium]|nr:tRNA1(Val) (adenine(37)-N6)-methyltransferase [Clostridiales bacterium]
MLDNGLISPGERLDDLQIPPEGGKPLRVIQDPGGFCFGVDAVLLADFAKPPKGGSVADLGCGCGVIPLLLAAKTEAARITGVEIQKNAAQMAARSVLLNGLEGKITIIHGDLKTFGAASAYDTVTCNPPYKERGGGLLNPGDSLAIARHEVCCTLADVIKTAARILKPGGKLNIIHRPERLADLLCLMREHRLEPKRMRFAHPSPRKTAVMVLTEAARGGRPKLFLEPPLYIHDEDGNDSEEIARIYGRR